MVFSFCYTGKMFFSTAPHQNSTNCRKRDKRTWNGQDFNRGKVFEFSWLHIISSRVESNHSSSVAEIAQRPLYRVTCGDIGTKAEDVENVSDKSRTWVFTIYTLMRISLTLLCSTSSSSCSWERSGAVVSSGPFV